MNGVILRISIYLLIVLLTGFYDELKDLDGEKILKFTWIDWCKFCIPTTIATLTTFRAYVDSSLHNLRLEQKQSIDDSKATNS